MACLLCGYSSMPLHSFYNPPLLLLSLSLSFLYHQLFLPVHLCIHHNNITICGWLLSRLPFIRAVEYFITWQSSHSHAAHFSQRVEKCERRMLLGVSERERCGRFRWAREETEAAKREDGVRDERGNIEKCCEGSICRQQHPLPPLLSRLHGCLATPAVVPFSYPQAHSGGFA